ncbi:HAD family hydrolase [Thiohalomonas denitrificans]|uniref:Phosphoglycolate phosphatase n=1 Tax=Thiohalomonas denitrificans TaxID=415747 RepID=A0A1G5PIK7_9GAMM|nr:HAD-IA family hydrolase [Thiohalomonas denitrificans]SCZ49248.1 phosphoglycolate phosphatase [Thiohalomonas denitrificans]
MSIIKTVLFDLDGTLADTAPDLADALNAVLIEEDRAPLGYEAIRPVVSHGGIALIRLGFGLEPGAPDFDRLRSSLLEHYRAEIATRTQLFPGMDELLSELERRQMAWGVVTNKPAWLTQPLMAALGLSQRAATIVSGDTVPENKPHPAPMHRACHDTGTAPQSCLYIGDAERDIVAGRNAGMATLVALWGYLGETDHPGDWGANGMIEEPQLVLDWLTATAPASNL